MFKHTVIIPTAGVGSRMGSIGNLINKSLVPYKAKPVLSHIIENFPLDTRYIIPVGYKAEQVKNFCELVYPERHIEFVEIDDYTSSLSGPGYTVSKCLKLLDEPFWYIPCDTYFNEDLTTHSLIENIYFVKSVTVELSEQYTMFKVNDSSRIEKMTFKEKQDEEWLALTGVMYIHDWQNFKNRLLTLNSPEIIWTIPENSKVMNLSTWLDFGNLNVYKNAVTATQSYDFTKIDEYTYITNGKVAKWWENSTVAEKKYRKWSANPTVGPTGCMFKNSWLVYDYFPGTTVYENHSEDILKNMLSWLKESVWIDNDVDISKSSLEFYKTKTLSRINKFLEKYPLIENATHVDGIEVKSWEYYYNNIDWSLLTTVNLPGYIHGDLHFDNTVIDSEDNFKVIDWRHEFADLVETGDIYYDLAKLTGGFIINYSKIKENKFTYTNHDGIVSLSIPNVDNCETYIKIVREFTVSNGWNYDKVKLLVPIIFWNMAPLHTAPFDKFLWYLGIKLFSEIIKDEHTTTST